MTRSATSVLSDVFGYPEFRSDQAAIIEHLIAGGDCLVLMPTGGGKSLCYQVPALVRDGIGIVISPLIALMQDQVAALQQLGVAATYLNSSLPRSTQNEIEQDLLAGRYDLLYVAPERLLTDRFLALLGRITPALFAIDEAHCVSMWGHDFRPEYRQLRVLHERFGGVPRIALTATADEPTRADIVSHLDLGSARIFISSFDRPNIRYRIVDKVSPMSQLTAFLKEHPGSSGIVYRFSRRKVEETAEALAAKGWRALPYHAGLDAATRRQHQHRFVHEEGTIIVATIAFGMGIDKPDVRFVVHLDLPRSVESYYQETGRAGRDGLPADALLLFGAADIGSQQHLIDISESSDERKRIERQKLSELLAYCETSSCRRQLLLSHFGERHPGSCGNCDNCLNPPRSWDGTVAAQKALSCAYRTGERYGIGHLIDVLLGRRTEKVERARHDHVSTFGIGTDLSEAQWRAVFRQLVAMELLVVDVDRKGGLRLTEASRPVLKGEQIVTLREDVGARKTKAKPKSRPAAVGFADLDPADVALWEALRASRTRLASEQGVPPYVIFNDATLRELVRKRPRSKAELSSISGIGSKKLEMYGDEIIAVIGASV